MQLNVLDDLAKAMKALDGKKMNDLARAHDLELRIIEFFSEWLVALLMPARHVLETRSPHWTEKKNAAIPTAP